MKRRPVSLIISKMELVLDMPMYLGKVGVGEPQDCRLEETTEADYQAEE
jgi:hypothetical protein